MGSWLSTFLFHEQLLQKMVEIVHILLKQAVFPDLIIQNGSLTTDKVCHGHFIYLHLTGNICKRIH